jgi:hypothetical protein
MNDEHKLWQSSNMQIDAMEAAEGKIPHGHSSESTSEALPVAPSVSWERIRELYREYREDHEAVLALVEPQQKPFLQVRCVGSSQWIDCEHKPHHDDAEKFEKRYVYLASPDATPQIENALPNEQKILPHIVIQDSNDNGFVFKVVKQIGEDYLSKIVAENAADKLNMLRG